MPRLTPQHWRVLDCVFRKAGFDFIRQSSSHRVYEREGTLRPLVIPEYDSVSPAIISGLLRTAEMDRNEYFLLLEKC